MLHNLNELIERLVDIRDEMGEEAADDCLVRFAYQPSWPLVGSVDAISLQRNSAAKGREGTVLWLASDGAASYNEDPYAPKAAFDDDEFNDEEDEDEDE